MKLHFIAVAVCASVALQGCAALGIETCGLGATRCRGDTVQICKTGLGWTDSAECRDVGAAEGGSWTCGTPKGVCGDVHQCMPVLERSEPAPAPKLSPTPEKKTK
jgi:hypothetical protein